MINSYDDLDKSNGREFFVDSYNTGSNRLACNNCYQQQNLKIKLRDIYPRFFDLQQFRNKYVELMFLPYWSV